MSNTIFLTLNNNKSVFVPTKLNLSKEKLFFANKNLFANASIKPLPSSRVEDRARPKLEEDSSFVKTNYLSSSKALKYKEEV